MNNVIYDCQKLFDSVDTCPLGVAPGCGVYFVCFRPRLESKLIILYIGSSKNMRSRLSSSNHPYQKIFQLFHNELVFTKEIHTDDYRNMEEQMINHFTPVLNIQHGNQCEALFSFYTEILLDAGVELHKYRMHDKIKKRKKRNLISIPNNEQAWQKDLLTQGSGASPS